MSTKDPNMKVVFGADTNDFDKGARDVKQGLKDLDKSTTSMLSSIGSAFGVNTQKVEQMTSAMKGLGQKMSECGDAGVKAFGNVLKSISPLAGAIAGIGIGAAIAGFKALHAEADAFRQTVEGANMELATAAYIDTYRQALRDFRGDFGKSIAEAENGFSKFFKTIGANIGTMFSTGASWKQFMPGGSVLGVQGWVEYAKQVNTAKEKANDAAYLTAKIGELEFERKKQSVEIAKLNDQIAASLNKAKDATVSLAERQAAVRNAEDLIAQKKTMELPIVEKIASYYNEIAGLATNTKQAEETRLQASALQYETSRAITQEETSLLRIKNSIGKASEAEINRMNELIKKQKELEDNIKRVREKWADISAAGAITGTSPNFPGVTVPVENLVPTQHSVDTFQTLLTEYFSGITIGVGIAPTKSSIVDISTELENGIVSATTRTSEIMGNLVGTLAAGGDAWGDFKDAALSSLGDMAIAVGKIAIKTGVSMLGIKAALNLDNPYVAIAAGAALVALGSAVKSSLSAVASGDYSAGGGGYSGNYSSSGSNSGYDTREVNVNVTGTLTANGDQLITVINNTNKKNYYTQ